MKTKLFSALVFLLLSFLGGFAQSPQTKNECVVKPPYNPEYWCSVVVPEVRDNALEQSAFSPFLKENNSRFDDFSKKEKFYMRMPADQMEEGEKFRATFRFKDDENSFSEK